MKEAVVFETECTSLICVKTVIETVCVWVFVCSYVFVKSTFLSFKGTCCNYCPSCSHQPTGERNLYASIMKKEQAFYTIMHTAVVFRFDAPHFTVVELQ